MQSSPAWLGRAISRLLLLVGAPALAAACGSSLSKFPLKEPMWTDPDSRPVEEKPEEYVSPFAWDGANQTIFRPIARFFAVDPAGAAVNVNALDEVPDSSWFQNRIGRFPMSPVEVARGACDTAPLDPDETWKVTGAKPDGANPGFLIKGPDGKRYLIKFDGLLQGPRATAADVIGSRLYHAAGYYAPCNRIVYLHRSSLKIADDATVEDSRGRKHPLEEKHVEEVLSKALQLRDGRYRASSSLFLEGAPLGPFTYEGTRGDDPNDVVRHEDRRELRGMRLLAAWVNHFDSREQNTLSMWIEGEEGRGYVRHNVIDFGDCLGSLWQPASLGRRIGHSYYLDFPYLFEDWLTLGLIQRPWERITYGKSGVVFAYFDAETFDAEKWRPGYPNPAFGRMQEHDGAWMARIIARFDDERVRSMMATADLRHSVLEQELFRILKVRRDKILDRYLSRLSPLTQPEVRGGKLCLTDLLLSAQRVRQDQRRYSSRAYSGEALTMRQLDIVAEGDARVCSTLPQVSGASAAAPGYLIIDFVAQSQDRQPQPPARVHLYHLGGAGYRVVGLERPDDDDPPG